VRIEELPARIQESPAAPRDVPAKRLWLGVEGSLDVTFASSADDECATVQGRPTNRDHFCTMGGADANGDDLQRGQLDSVAGGPALGNTRVKLRLDWAIDEHWIAGLRAGYVFGTYPGEAARREGRGFLPVDLEARMTHLIGRRPLARGSVTQYLYLGAGVAQTDVRVAVDVVDRSGKVTNVDAWELGGLFYVSAGLGVRYALADNVGASFGPRFALPLAGGAILPVASPEAALSFGF
jgi:hypothetical protein